MSSRVTERMIYGWTLRTLICTWATIWLVAIPLYHVHPDANHHHNESGPHHGGIAHSIFSGDLDGEFGTHTAAGGQEPGTLSAHSVCLLEDSPELGFSFLSDSSDRKPFKS